MHNKTEKDMHRNKAYFNIQGIFINMQGMTEIEVGKYTMHNKTEKYMHKK